MATTSKHSALRQDRIVADEQAKHNAFNALPETFAQIGEIATEMHSFSQANLLEAIGRALIWQMGTNRAKREELQESVMAYASRSAGQKSELTWDQNGVFTGHEPTTHPTDINGNNIASLWNLMTEKQQLFYQDLILNEDRLWQMYHVAEAAWRAIQGSQDRMVKPWPDEKARGLVTLDDLVENAKTKAQAAALKKVAAKAAQEGKKTAEVVNFFAQMEARMRANGR